MNIDKTPQNIKKMFNKIAQNYDKMNDLISFGTDKIIKSKCIKLLNISKKSTVLDLCTGTGDLVKIIKKLYPLTKITAIDFSENMIKIAKKRIKNVEFINADATNLPFSEGIFDIITISYGLRNIENRSLAIQEMYRVIKPDGKVLHLDFGEKTIWSKIFEKIVPTMAKILKKDYESYKYLIKSKQTFPTPNELINEFEAQGFKLKLRKDFLLKSISCQIFSK